MNETQSAIVRKNAHDGPFGPGGQWLARLPLAAGVCVCLALLSGASECAAQQSAPLRLKRSAEIAPFRITGIEGYMTTRYLRDDSSASGQAGGPGMRQSLSTQGEELFVMTHSYVYHPGLLSLDLGGGPLIDKTNSAGDGVATRQGRQVYNLSGRATILRDKPYNGALFYDLRNQTQQLGPAQIMLTENARTGFEFALLRPVTPAPLRVDATHSTNQGSGADQVTDDRIDRLRLRMDADVGALGTTAFQYQATHQASRNGSPGLPIQASTSDTGLVNLDTRVKFGADKQYDLFNLITLNSYKYAFSQGPALDFKDFRFSLDLRGRHSAELQTYGRYDLNSSKQGDQVMDLNSFGGGVTYRLNPNLSGTLAARGERNKTGPSASNLYGLDGSAQYRRALSLGEASVGYGFSYLQREQVAGAQQARIIGEAVTLSGTSLVRLNREQISAGSVTVSNLSRTQTYVEGSDYLLTVVGLTTRIQRTVGGNILDGQELLVDYTYDFGGSYGLQQLDQNVNFNWAFRNYLNAYLRFADSAPQLTSGTPTFPLNPAKTSLYGARGEIPLDLWLDTRVGGNAEHENRREAISPYQRTSLEAYAQLALPWVRNGDLRLGTRRMRIDYDYSPAQGVNLSAYDMRLSSRLPYNVDVSLDATRERDTGTPIARERSYLVARARWRMRKLQWTFELQRTQDAQGESQRTRSYAQFTLRRDF